MSGYFSCSSIFTFVDNYTVHANSTSLLKELAESKQHSLKNGLTGTERVTELLSEEDEVLTAEHY